MRALLLLLVALASPLAAQPVEYLYWIDKADQSIYRLASDSDTPEVVVPGASSGVTGLVIDSEAGRLYRLVTDYGLEHSIIVASKLDGTEPDTLHGPGCVMFGTNDVALDAEEGWLYGAVESDCVKTPKFFFRVRPDGTELEFPDHNDSKFPLAMEYDATADVLYGVSHAPYPHSDLYRADLQAGTAARLLRTSSRAHDVALDLRAGKIYWTEDIHSIKGDARIMRANLDGSGEEEVVGGLNSAYGVLIDSTNAVLYWSEPEYGSEPAAGAIRRMPLGGGPVETVIEGMGMPLRLAYYAEHTTTAAETPVETSTAALGAPRPNPASARTALPVRLVRPGHVRVMLFDVLGRTVRVLLDETRAPSAHEIVLDTRSLTPGTYVVRLTVDGKPAEGQRLVVVR